MERVATRVAAGAWFGGRVGRHSGVSARPHVPCRHTRESVGHRGGILRRTETSISVEQDVDRSTTALFAVLVDPRRHVEMDGSGMLRAGEGAVVIDHVDQVFSMAMHYPSLVTTSRTTESWSSNQTVA